VEDDDSRPDADLSTAALERTWQEAVLETGASDRADVDAQLAQAVFGSPFNVEFENELAIVSGFDDKPFMRQVAAPEDLIDQVLNLTRERGAKAKLARALKVSRQRLNEWLSGRSKPSARYLLLLLNWTRHQQHRAKPKNE
jgi:DNA-binding phage protein